MPRDWPGTCCGRSSRGGARADVTCPGDRSRAARGRRGRIRPTRRPARPEAPSGPFLGLQRLPVALASHGFPRRTESPPRARGAAGGGEGRGDSSEGEPESAAGAGAPAAGAPRRPQLSLWRPPAAASGAARRPWSRPAARLAPARELGLLIGRACGAAEADWSGPAAPRARPTPQGRRGRHGGSTSLRRWPLLRSLRRGARRAADARRDGLREG